MSETWSSLLTGSVVLSMYTPATENALIFGNVWALFGKISSFLNVNALERDC